MGLNAWVDARNAAPAILQLRRRVLEPSDAAAAWAVDAWAGAHCWIGLLDHFTALAGAARDGDPEACGSRIQRIDETLQAVALLLADIELPGGTQCVQAVELMRAQFGSGDLPDLELMDHVGAWISHAVTGNHQARSIGRLTA